MDYNQLLELLAIKHPLPSLKPNLNLSEGPNRRLNANDNAFDGKETFGINESASSCKRVQTLTKQC